MTSKEKSDALQAWGCVKNAIIELEYYNKQGYLRDKGALYHAQDAAKFLDSLLGFNKKHK